MCGPSCICRSSCERLLSVGGCHSGMDGRDRPVNDEVRHIRNVMRLLNEKLQVYIFDSIPGLFDRKIDFSFRALP